MYKHVAGPRKGGLFVEYEQNPKLQKPKQHRSNRVAADSMHEVMSNEDSSLSTAKLHPYGFLIKGKNRYQTAEIGL